MCRPAYFLAIVFIGWESFLTQSASAQSGYTPQTPTISPWMNLWQNKTGTLGNYQSVVVPQMQLNQTLQMQNARFPTSVRECKRWAAMLMSPGKFSRGFTRPAA